MFGWRSSAALGMAGPKMRTTGIAFVWDAQNKKPAQDKQDLDGLACSTRAIL